MASPPLPPETVSVLLYASVGAGFGLAALLSDAGQTVIWCFPRWAQA